MSRRLPDLREARATLLLVLGLGLALNVAATALVNRPLADSLGRSRAEVEALMVRLEGRRAEVGALRRGVDRIREQVVGLERFYEEVLAAKDVRMVAVQRELREIAERHGIRPETVAYRHEPADRSGEMVRFAATFPLRGSYEALRAFIRDVEHSRNFLIVDSIDLTDAREGGALLALNINVSTIFRDPEYRRVQGGG